jgi:hypothetical protein
MDTKLELTDPIEIENFKLFCQHRQKILKEERHWQDLRAYCKQMNFGSFTLVVEDGLPKRIQQPLQSIVFGINLTN